MGSVTAFKSHLGRMKAPASLMLYWRLSGVDELQTHKMVYY